MRMATGRGCSSSPRDALRGVMRALEPVLSLVMARQFAGYHRKLRSNLEAD